MSEAIPCLIRVGDNIKKNKIIRLEGNQVTIGRSSEVTCALKSEVISRCHAILKRKEDGEWAIKDNESRNGVFVNGNKLVSSSQRTLQDGDMVQFGVSKSPNEPAEFLYKFHVKVRVKKASNKRLKQDPASTSSAAVLGAGSQTESDDEERKRKEPLAGCSSRLLPPCTEQSSKSSNESKEAEYLAKVTELKNLLKEKERQQLEAEEQLENEKQERQKKIQEMEELRMKEQVILMEMQDKQSKLEKEKEVLKQRMEAEREANQREMENALVSQLAAEKELLLEESKKVEETLKASLFSKSKEFEQQLFSMKKDLEQVIEAKDKEQKLLENQLDETKKENETSKLQALQAREEVLSNFVDLMEMELQCTICNELFIKATALNCAHVFCKLCINQWVAVKNECPICRIHVTSQMQAFALDSYIEKMVEQFSDELKKKREDLLEQRKVEQEKFDEPRQPKVNPNTPTFPLGAPSVSRGRRGRNRGRGSRGRRGRNTRNATASTSTAVTSRITTTPTLVPPITIASTTATTHGRFTRTSIATPTTVSTPATVSTAAPTTSNFAQLISSSSSEDDEYDDDMLMGYMDEMEDEMDDGEELVWGRFGSRRRWSSWIGWYDADSDEEEDE